MKKNFSTLRGRDCVKVVVFVSATLLHRGLSNGRYIKRLVAGVVFPKKKKRLTQTERDGMGIMSEIIGGQQWMNEWNVDSFLLSLFSGRYSGGLSKKREVFGRSSFLLCGERRTNERTNEALFLFFASSDDDAKSLFDSQTAKFFRLRRTEVDELTFSMRKISGWGKEEEESRKDQWGWPQKSPRSTVNFTTFSTVVVILHAAAETNLRPKKILLLLNSGENSADRRRRPLRGSTPGISGGSAKESSSRKRPRKRGGRRRFSIRKFALATRGPLPGRPSRTRRKCRITRTIKVREREHIHIRTREVHIHSGNGRQQSATNIDHSISEALPKNKHGEAKKSFGLMRSYRAINAEWTRIRGKRRAKSHPLKP